jgi:transposase
VWRRRYEWQRCRCATARRPSELYYRRIAQRRGADIAVFAAARKLATLIYRLLRWGQPYVDEGAAAFENRYRQRRIHRLEATAKELGYQLTPVPA